ncbi:MAG: Wzt carbohydrate-binding domain-containing protein [Rhizomicrobium sp.]
MTLCFEKSFLFDHLPKTGGTAWRTVLEEMFGPENVTQHLEGRSEIWAVQRFSGFKVISGHFLSLLPSVGGSARLVRMTILREPIDRAISEYYYWRHHAHEGVADRLGQWAQEYDICDFFRARAESNETAATNFYTKHFANRLTRDLMNEEKLLAFATRSLKNYGFVGIYENLHDSADMFCWKFGLPPVQRIPRVNVTASRVGVSDLDRPALAMLTEINNLDVQLYRQALAAFEASRRRMFRELLRKSSRVRRPRFGAPGPRGRSHSGQKPKSSLRPVGDHSNGAAQPAGSVAAAAQGISRKQESFGSGEVEIVAAQVIGSDSGTNEVAPGERVSLCVSISAHADVSDLTVGIEISDSFGEVVFGTNTFQRNAVRPVVRGRHYDVTFGFAANLNRGRYSVGVALHTGANHAGCCFHWRDNVTTFDVVQFGEPDFIGYCRLEPSIEWLDATISGSSDEADAGGRAVASA